jgi:hypothetical protein
MNFDSWLKVEFHALVLSVWDVQLSPIVEDACMTKSPFSYCGERLLIMQAAFILQKLMDKIVKLKLTVKIILFWR